MIETRKPLSALSACLKPYPQILKNMKVKTKPPFEALPTVLKLVRAAEKDLGDRGRVLLRYSGTEPKVRLLIEGEDQARIEAHANRIIEKLQEMIGV